MMDDNHAQERGFNLPVDRNGRLRAFCDGYGMDEHATVDRIITAQEELRNRILSATEGGPPIYALLKSRGLAEQMHADILFTQTWREHRSGPADTP